MNEFYSPDSLGENHISEIKEDKRSRKKSGFSFSTFLVTLIVSVIVSAASGAFGAFFMYNFISADVKAETTTQENEFVIVPPEEISEATRTEPETATAEAVTEEQPVFIPEATSGTAIQEAVTEEQTTAAPVLSKGAIYNNAVNSIVSITASWKQYYSSLLGSYYRPVTSSGSGFFVTEDGYIITNSHVIENAEEITVTDYNGNQYPARLIGSEPENDVAVIKIDTQTLPVTLGVSSSLEVGDDILIIGNALGELSYTYTDGIVSHLSREVTLESGQIINMFQTNAAINNGNSGGPVYNMDGEVVGIASAKLASEKIEGLGFCIPIDDVRDMITDIIIFGYVTGKPLLGITVQTVTSSMSSRYSLPTGCYVVALDTSSSAYEQGLRNGDVITKLGNTKITSGEDIEAFLQSKNAGDKINLTYYRGGESFTVTVSLSEKKPSEPRTDYSNVFDF